MRYELLSTPPHGPTYGFSLREIRIGGSHYEADYTLGGKLTTARRVGGGGNRYYVPDRHTNILAQLQEMGSIYSSPCEAGMTFKEFRQLRPGDPVIDLRDRSHKWVVWKRWFAAIVCRLGGRGEKRNFAEWEAPYLTRFKKGSRSLYVE